MKKCPLCSTEYESGSHCPRDGATLINQGQDPFVGRVIKDSYRIEEGIGCGGAGIVYRALQLPLGRSVAIKLVRPDHNTSSEMIQRFLQEARLISSISHPNVVGIIDFGNTEDGLMYLVMEFLNGRTLASVVAEEGSLPRERIVGLLEQICAGVQAAHRHPLVHRDLKPANIFLAQLPDGTECVKLLDFGISKPLATDEPTLTKTGMFVGTPGYLAPEQILSTRQVDTRADIYALGGILYFMLTGRRPFDGDSITAILAKQTTSDPDPVALTELKGPDCECLLPIVHTAMRINVADRYQTVAELLKALRNASPEALATTLEKVPQAVSQVASSQPPKISSRGGRNIRGLAARKAALGAALCILVGVIGVASRSVEERPAVAAASVSKLTPAPAPAVRGVTPELITIGMTAPFSGPARELGRSVRIGLEACFKSINNAGGVHGRKIKLIALDDGYDPAVAAANTKKLVDEYKVFAVVGSVGTPTTEASLPILLESRTLLFAPLTGADSFRKDPPDRYVFNFRAGYDEETASIVKYLMNGKGLRPDQIGVFAQDDSFGEAGIHGVHAALKELGADPGKLFVARYARNSLDVESAVKRVLSARERLHAIILVATYGASARFTIAVRKGHFRGLLANVSFVGSRALAEEFRELGPSYGDGVIVTQVVPPIDDYSTLAVRYREALANEYPYEQTGFSSLEGFIAGTIFSEALKRAGRSFGAESFIDTLEAFRNIDIGTGTAISFAPSDHQASHKVWGTVLSADGAYRSLDLSTTQ